MTVPVIIGLSLLIVVGGWSAASDARVANPARDANASPAALEGYLALRVAGVGLAVVRATVALVRVRGQLPRAMIIWV